MTKYFAGNSLAAFVRSSSSIVEVTTSGRFDSAFVASGINIPDGFLETHVLTTATTIWLRFDHYSAKAIVGNGNWIEFVNSSGVVVARLRNPSGSAGATVAFQYWDGAAFVTSGSAFDLPTNNTLATVVVKIVCGASGSWEVFYNGASVGSGAISDADTNNIARHRFISIQSNLVVSQVMIADYDISDHHFKPLSLTGNSAANTGAASGAFGDVNETALDDTTLIAISTSANKAGQTKAALTLPGGYTIAAMVVSARGRVTSPITDGKLGIRSGGTNYSSAGLGFAGGYAPRQRIDENDPATSAAWGLIAFNNAEPYLEAA